MSKQNKAKLRGYMFEVVISKLLENNGFTKVTKSIENIIRIRRRHFIEFKGRGGWHQIDCPFDYDSMLPFMNPLRLLGEVKFYASPIQKHLIRENIGITKDIQENSFVDNMGDTFQPRYTELSVFFSASGFSDESEMLAYAHNIKTISYKNVELIEPICKQIFEICKNYLEPSKCISFGKQSDFIDDFSSLLNIPNTNREFSIKYGAAEGFERIIESLSSNLLSIKTSFIANSSSGVFLHFVSESKFPDSLFENTDTQNVRVGIENDENGNRRFWIVFSNGDTRNRFHFRPPESLREAALYQERGILEEKQRHFASLNVLKKINGVSRNLILKLDVDWLNAIRTE